METSRTASERKLIRSKWLYKLKHNKDREPERYKARLLVAQGYTQKYGVDLFEAYLPVVSAERVRLMFAMLLNLF